MCSHGAAPLRESVELAKGCGACMQDCFIPRGVEIAGHCGMHMWDCPALKIKRGMSKTLWYPHARMPNVE